MPVYQLSPQPLFPLPHWAEPDGLLAVGGDLSCERLLLAYSQGIFPWYSAGEPILWWSPDPRCVLFTAAVHVSRRLERTLRRRPFRLTCNRAFAQVVEACAGVRIASGNGTWLTAEMQAAYLQLHREGYAHSVEAWDGDRLVGGIYGVGLGPLFFGESMFHRATDASKVVLVALCRHLAARGLPLIDCQVPNPHLYRMGACNVPRRDFLALLERAGLKGRPPWPKLELPAELDGGQGPRAGG